MKTITWTGIVILVLCLSIFHWAVAQSTGGFSSSDPEAIPAYVVEEISKPPIVIMTSQKKNEIISGDVTNLSIKYEKKLPTAPQRVLLGVEYGNKHNLLIAKDDMVLSEPRGAISLSLPVAVAHFMIDSLRLNKSVHAPAEEIVEIRIALYEKGANPDYKNKTTYGRQVSNRVSLRLKTDLVKYK